MTLEARHAILDALPTCGQPVENFYAPVDSGYWCRFLISIRSRVLANAIGCGNVISRCQEGC